MEDVTFFNLDPKEFQRRASVNFKEYDSNAPVSKESALLACLAGSKRLLSENKDLLREIYRSKEERS